MADLHGLLGGVSLVITTFSKHIAKKLNGGTPAMHITKLF
jgi:hypothetical protein